MSELYKIANKILQNGKGILAADESTGTMKKRLDSVNVESNEKNRLIFRETLFSSNSMKECIGGVILYDETIRQNTSQNKSIPELISQSGAVPGIKVDTGAKILAGSKEEKITEGLDGLRERLKDYYQLGARFTKWIVEPEVLMDGKHSAKDCFNKTSEVIKRCYDELDINKVDLKGTILKPNMILPGTDSNETISNNEVAEMTLESLKNNVPSEVPGVAFLSGGQTEVEATNNLNQINIKNDSSFIMTYSYGRALQQSALKFWSKDVNNIKGTQEVFDHRAKMCTLAAQGKWSESLENSK